VQSAGGRRCRKATAPTEPAGETHTDVCQDFLCNMTAEDTVQMDGVRLLEVPFSKKIIRNTFFTKI
ncbi:MAG: hypothetical protein II589_05550, partial [Clostridia bacterium]|nr:hypothetical protein [Clostridia bacterium]